MERQDEEYERCIECIDAFRREVGSFNPSVCRFCDYGAKAHRKEVRNGDPWESIDWNNFRYKDYYKG